jgi:capsid portal protein
MLNEKKIEKELKKYNLSWGDLPAFPPHEWQTEDFISYIKNMGRSIELYKKFKLVDYKGKWFVIKDKEEELDYVYGEITKEEALEEDFVAKHKENCKYYGIPAYIGKDKELKRIYD